MQYYLFDKRWKRTKINLRKKIIISFIKGKKIYSILLKDIINYKKLKKFKRYDDKIIYIREYLKYLIKLKKFKKLKFIKVKKIKIKKAKIKKVKKMEKIIPEIEKKKNKYEIKQYYFKLDPNKEGDYLYYKLLNTDINKFENSNKYKKITITIRIIVKFGKPVEFTYKFYKKFEYWKYLFNLKQFWLYKFKDIIKVIIDIVKKMLGEQGFAISGHYYQKKRAPVEFEIWIKVIGWYGKVKNYKQKIKKLNKKILEHKKEVKQDLLRQITELSEKLLYKKYSKKREKKLKEKLKKLNERFKTL